jgi:hypothetical protein
MLVTHICHIEKIYQLCLGKKETRFDPAFAASVPIGQQHQASQMRPLRLQMLAKTSEAVLSQQRVLLK